MEGLKYQLIRNKQRLNVGDFVFHPGNLSEILFTELPEKEALYDFLVDWFSESDSLTVQTSGSTGKPKLLQVKKKHMMASAKMTCDFLHLKPGNRALLCLPLKYIAGKMVVVRALVAQLNLLLVVPSSHPLVAQDGAIDFAAMIPLQVYSSLEKKKEKKALQQIKQLIIGGGAVDDALASQLVHFPYAVWSTYGMTETVSHIALRRLNGENKKNSYTPMAGVQLSLSEEQTLVISAPEICDEVLVTHDVVTFNSRGDFQIQGRLDLVINSGGVKIQLEKVEDCLRKHISIPFQITCHSDAKLGQVVVLLTEGRGEELEKIKKASKLFLPTYWRPKYYYSVDKLPITETGKPNRKLACFYASSLAQNKE